MIMVASSKAADMLQKQRDASRLHRIIDSTMFSAVITVAILSNIAAPLLLIYFVSVTAQYRVTLLLQEHYISLQGYI